MDHKLRMSWKFVRQRRQLTKAAAAIPMYRHLGTIMLLGEKIEDKGISPDQKYQDEGKAKRKKSR